MHVGLQPDYYRFCFQPVLWQGGFKNPYSGIIVWPEPDPVKTKLTLFKVNTNLTLFIYQLKERYLDLSFHVSLVLKHHLKRCRKLV